MQIDFHQGVGPVLDPLRDQCIRRATMRWVVFDAAVLRRIMRGSDNDAAGQSRAQAPVVGEDGVGDDRGRRIAAILVHHDLDAMGRQLRRAVRVHAQVERAKIPSIARYS